MKDRTVF